MKAETNPSTSSFKLWYEGHGELLGHGVTLMVKWWTAASGRGHGFMNSCVWPPGCSFHFICVVCFGEGIQNCE